MADLLLLAELPERTVRAAVPELLIALSVFPVREQQADARGGTSRLSSNELGRLSQLSVPRVSHGGQLDGEA
ncbi:MAG TPA: hypothetical protein VII66_03695 [Gemmatimonadaceae bacterium]